MIYLSLDQPSQIFREFLKEQRITLHHMSNGDNPTAFQRISEQLVLDSLGPMLDPESYPILVCCNLGRHRTGTVIGCLRRLQHWKLPAIFDEFRRYAGFKPSPLHEQFIELFDTDLVTIPENSCNLPFVLTPGTHKEQPQPALQQACLPIYRNGSEPLKPISHPGSL